MHYLINYILYFKCMGVLLTYDYTPVNCKLYTAAAWYYGDLGGTHPLYSLTCMTSDSLNFTHVLST